MIKTFIIIPCYNPDYSFTRFFNNLHKYLNEDVQCLVVSDGSSEECLMLIEHTIQNKPFTQLLAYPNNQGKGFAIKYGISYLLEKNQDVKFNIITADCDGQHLVNDIIKFVERLQNDPLNHLLLGIRDYDSWIPFHSRLGHFLSNIGFKIFFNINLKDTHCGLRGFNSNIAKQLLMLPWNRFEFELAMIPYCVKNYFIVTEHIKGVYDKAQYKTTYRIKDWWYNLKSFFEIRKFLKRN